MPNLQRRDARWRRMLESIRSAWSGPLTSSSPEIARYFSDTPSHAGMNVTGETALTLPAFWAAVSLISSDLAKLPLVLYKCVGATGKVPYDDHHLYEILHDEPNPEMSSITFREVLQSHVLTWGNAYAEIERDRAGRVAALWPLTPNRVTPTRDPSDPYGALLYRVSNANGADTIFDSSEILHIPGLGYDGLIGYSVIAKARESVGLGLAMQEFGARFFGNGSSFGGILTAPTLLGPKQKEETIKSLREMHEGVARSHRFVLLDGGLTYQQLGIPPDDAQFLQSRTFHVREIARFFKVPPHKIADLADATFSNVEQMNIDYYTSCLQPWGVKWEQEINRKLIAPSERNIQFVKHNFRALLQGDTQARAEYYSKMFNIGAYSINMILELEDMNPIGPDGDTHYVPSTMAPVGSKPATQVQPPAQPVVDATPTDIVRQLGVMTERAHAAELMATEGRSDATRLREQFEQERATGTTTAQHLAARDEALRRALELSAQLTGASSELAEERDRLAALVADEQAKRAEQDRLASEQERIIAEANTARATVEQDAAQRIEQALARAAEAQQALTEREANYTTQLHDIQEQEAAIRTALEASQLAQREAEAFAQLHIARTAQTESELLAAQSLTVDARTGLTEALALVERLTTERDALSEDQVRLRADSDARLEMAHRDLESAQAHAVEAQIQVHDTEDTVARLETDLHAIRDEREALNREYARLRADAEAQHEHAQRNLATAETDAAASSALVQTTTATAEALQADIQTIRAERDAAAFAHEAAIRKVEALQAAGETQQRELADLQATIAQAEREREVMLAGLTQTADAERITRLAELADAQTQTDTLTHLCDELRHQISDLDTTHQSAVVTKDQELETLRATLVSLESDRDQQRQVHRDLEQRASGELSKRAQVEAALQAHHAHEAEREAAIMSSHRTLVAEVTRGMLERELDRARAAQATPQKLRQWMERFYEGHADVSCKKLLPAVRVHLAWMRSSEDPLTVTQQIVGDHIAESKRQLEAVIDGDADGLASSLYALCQRWETERINTIADRLMQKELERSTSRPRAVEVLGQASSEGLTGERQILLQQPPISLSIPAPVVHVAPPRRKRVIRDERGLITAIVDEPDPVA